MIDRLLLKEKLQKFIGKREDGKDNLFFQPPESVKLVYPCIIYKMVDARHKFSNNHTYNFRKGYEVTIITIDPDEEMVNRIAEEFIMCMFQRHFVNDNLHHYVFKIYW